MCRKQLCGKKHDITEHIDRRCRRKARSLMMQMQARSCQSRLIVLSCVLAISSVLLSPAQAQASGLRLNFYQTSCPNAETIARRTLRILALTDPTSFAALLRVAFHDCAVQGCDASIMLDSQAGKLTSERVAQKNFSIRRLNFIDRIKAALDNVCPGVVSCADVIVLAARDAILTTGGPYIPVLTGRRDSMTASNEAADAQLPSVTISIDAYLKFFGSLGMSTQESVAILGAHTLGVGHCVNIVNRLYPTLDPKLPPFFAFLLTLRCPSPTPTRNISFVNNDVTNFFFDNRYYTGLLRGTGVFSVDSELALDPRTRGFVTQFAQSQGLFFQAFTTAFLKLTSNKVLTGNNGQIRGNCRAVNS